MRDFDTATLDECRDYIARAMGWERITGNIPVECPSWTRRTTFPSGRVGVEELWCHPLAANLNSAADSLPDGCRWCDITFFRNGTIARCTDGRTIFVSNIEGDGSGVLEPLARFRASASAWAWVRENKP